jgi:hypothetical protein
MGIGHEAIKDSLAEGLEAAFDLGNHTQVEELLGIIESVPRGAVPQFLHAHAVRARAKLGAAAGDEDRAEQGFKSVIGMFRELVVPFWMAVSLLEYGEWLTQMARMEEAQALLAEARSIFQRLKANPWLERLDRAAQPPSVPIPVVARRD